MYVNIIFQALYANVVVLCWQVIGVPYDERPLPALQRKDQPVEATKSPAEQQAPQADAQRSLHSPELSREPEPLTDKAQREAGLPIEVYGESLVRKMGDIAFTFSWIFISTYILRKILLGIPSRCTVYYCSILAAPDMSQVCQISNKIPPYKNAKDTLR